MKEDAELYAVYSTLVCVGIDTNLLDVVVSKVWTDWYRVAVSRAPGTQKNFS